jgi:hypothetical protein
VIVVYKKGVTTTLCACSRACVRDPATLNGVKPAGAPWLAARLSFPPPATAAKVSASDPSPGTDNVDVAGDDPRLTEPLDAGPAVGVAVGTVPLDGMGGALTDELHAASVASTASPRSAFRRSGFLIVSSTERGET